MESRALPAENGALLTRELSVVTPTPAPSRWRPPFGRAGRSGSSPYWCSFGARPSLIQCIRAARPQQSSRLASSACPRRHPSRFPATRRGSRSCSNNLISNDIQVHPLRRARRCFVRRRCAVPPSINVREHRFGIPPGRSRAALRRFFPLARRPTGNCRNRSSGLSIAKAIVEAPPRSSSSRSAEGQVSDLPGRLPAGSPLADRSTSRERRSCGQLKRERRNSSSGIDGRHERAERFALQRVGPPVLRRSERSYHPLSRPQAGWSDQDPDHWLTAARGVGRAEAARA